MDRTQRVAFREEFVRRHAELAKDLTLSRSHVYTMKRDKIKTRLPSVTTVLEAMIPKPWMGPWSAKMQKISDRSTAVLMVQEILRDGWSIGTEELALLAGAKFDELLQRETAASKFARKTADLGTQIHALIDQHLNALIGVKTPDPDVSDRALELFDPWRRWAESVEIDPVAMEFKVFSEKHCLAGTVDCLAFVRGRLTLLDWKPPVERHSMHLQNVAYRMLLREMGLVGACDGTMIGIPRYRGDEPVCREFRVDTYLDEARWKMFQKLNEARTFIFEDEKAVESMKSPLSTMERTLRSSIRFEEILKELAR